MLAVLNLLILFQIIELNKKTYSEEILPMLFEHVYPHALRNVVERIKEGEIRQIAIEDLTENEIPQSALTQVEDFLSLIGLKDDMKKGDK